MTFQQAGSPPNQRAAFRRFVEHPRRVIDSVEQADAKSPRNHRRRDPRRCIRPTGRESGEATRRAIGRATRPPTPYARAGTIAGGFPQVRGALKTERAAERDASGPEQAAVIPSLHDCIDREMTEWPIRRYARRHRAAGLRAGPIGEPPPADASSARSRHWPRPCC